MEVRNGGKLYCIQIVETNFLPCQTRWMGNVNLKKNVFASEASNRFLTSDRFFLNKTVRERNEKSSSHKWLSLKVKLSMLSISHLTFSTQ